MRNSQHVKTTLITAKQYLQDQLNKTIRTDTVEYIVKQFEKQTEHNIMHTYSEHANRVPTGNDNSDTQ